MLSNLFLAYGIYVSTRFILVLANKRIEMEVAEKSINQNQSSCWTLKRLKQVKRFISFFNLFYILCLGAYIVISVLTIPGY